MRMSKEDWRRIEGVDPFEELQDATFEFDASESPLDVLHKLVLAAAEPGTGNGYYIIVHPSLIDDPERNFVYGGVTNPNRWFVINDNNHMDGEPPTIVGWGTCIRKDTP